MSNKFANVKHYNHLKIYFYSKQEITVLSDIHTDIQTGGGGGGKVIDIAYKLYFALVCDQ